MRKEELKDKILWFIWENRNPRPLEIRDHIGGKALEDPDKKNSIWVKVSIALKELQEEDLVRKQVISHKKRHYLLTERGLLSIEKKRLYKMIDNLKGDVRTLRLFETLLTILTRHVVIMVPPSADFKDCLAMLRHELSKEETYELAYELAKSKGYITKDV